jgi:hypothetical protein
MLSQHRAVDESLRQERNCIDDAIHGNQDSESVQGTELVPVKVAKIG